MGQQVSRGTSAARYHADRDSPRIDSRPGIVLGSVRVDGDPAALYKRGIVASFSLPGIAQRRD
jgi:hypothetical protein